MGKHLRFYAPYLTMAGLALVFVSLFFGFLPAGVVQHVKVSYFDAAFGTLDIKNSPLLIASYFVSILGLIAGFVSAILGRLTAKEIRPSSLSGLISFLLLLASATTDACFKVITKATQVGMAPYFLVSFLMAGALLQLPTIFFSKLK
jgi:hypothetical protein